MRNIVFWISVIAAVVLVAMLNCMHDKPVVKGSGIEFQSIMTDTLKK